MATLQNIDDMSIDERACLGADKCAHPLQRQYAARRNVAEDYRIAGDIISALAIEAACESIYQRLPMELRW